MQSLQAKEKRRPKPAEDLLRTISCAYRNASIGGRNPSKLVPFNSNGKPLRLAQRC